MPYNGKDKNNPVKFIDPTGMEGEPTYIAKDILPEVVVTATRTSRSWSSESSEFDYNGTFKMYQSHYPEFKGMNDMQAWNYWKDNYSEAFGDYKTEEIKKARAEAAVLKMYQFALWFELLGIVNAVDVKIPTKVSKSFFIKPSSIDIQGTNTGANALSKGELLRIENAATRINKPINVIGSRAKGIVVNDINMETGRLADWDYIIDGMNYPEASLGVVHFYMRKILFVFLLVCMSASVFCCFGLLSYKF